MGDQSMLRGSMRGIPTTSSSPTTIGNATSSSNASIAETQTAVLPGGLSVSSAYTRVVTIKSVYNSYCLKHHTSHFLDSDNDRLKVESCDGSESQEFIFYGSSGLKAFDSNRCLEVYQGWKWLLQSQVFAQACNGKESQEWAHEFSGIFGDIIQNKEHWLCLEVDTETGWVSVKNCHSGSNQRWQIQDVP